MSFDLCFFKKKTAYETRINYEFRRVHFRSDRTVNAQCVADANCDGRIRCRRVAKTAELDVATYRAEEGRIGSILAIADDFSVQPATGVVLVGIIGRVECDDAAAQNFRVIGTVDRRPAAAPRSEERRVGKE